MFGKTAKMIAELRSELREANGRQGNIATRMKVLEAKIQTLEAVCNPHAVSQVNVGRIEQEVRKQFLEGKYKSSLAEKADELNAILDTKGASINKKREELYQLQLKADREQKPHLAAEYKNMVRALDWVIGGAK